MPKNFFKISFLITLLHFPVAFVFSQPNWPAIKSNATFNVADTTYATPYIQPLNVGGWEDGLFMTRDGRQLFSTFLPVDALSWLTDLLQNPFCFDFRPYFRPPLLGIDTITNIFGCTRYLQSDIIRAYRPDTNFDFVQWNSSNLQTPFSMEGGAHGVLASADSFDVFVFTRDGLSTQNMDILFLRNVSTNPSDAGAVPILNTPANEDNPHIERLNDTTLLLMFDRDRYIYYSLSHNNGQTWDTATLVSTVLNDQAPYDVQPHLWNDGTDWWVYFCADGLTGRRGIYKSKQLVAGDWGNWSPKELVIESAGIPNNEGGVYGIGEPSLTQWGDLSFVVIYGNTNSADTTDLFDCDPWILPKKSSPIMALRPPLMANSCLQIFPNPTAKYLNISTNARPLKNLKIINSIGQTVLCVKEPSISERLPVEHLPSGIYTVVGQADAQIQTAKFVKY